MKISRLEELWKATQAGEEVTILLAPEGFDELSNEVYGVRRTINCDDSPPFHIREVVIGQICNQPSPHGIVTAIRKKK